MFRISLPSRTMPSWTMVVSTAVVLVMAAAQAWFGYSIRHLDPQRDYLSPVPSRDAQNAMAFGDAQFLHRMFALEVQNAGDTGGRIVPIRNYDFSRVIGWLEVLENLDPRSDFAIGMADGYFGQSQDLRDVEPIIHFMMRDVALDPAHKWKWLYGAVYLARHRLHDDSLALQPARQLASYDFEGIDAWAGMLPAFILEDSGNYREAAEVVENLVRRFGPRLSKDDAAWTSSYLAYLSKVESGAVPPRKRSWKDTNVP